MMATCPSPTAANATYDLARWGDTTVILVRHVQNESTSLSIDSVRNIAIALADFPVITNDDNVLPRHAQLEEIARFSGAGRRRASPLERSRFGWCDAPRRPGYRAVRRR